MAKVSRHDSFFAVKPKELSSIVYEADDLILLAVTIHRDPNYRIHTITDLTRLGRYVSQGWQIVATMGEKGAGFYTIIYTLYRPL